MLKHLSGFYYTTRTRFRRRKLYRSWADVARSYYLALTIPQKPNASSAPPRLIRLNLKAIPDPIWMRAGHSDFMVSNEIFENGEYTPIRRWNLPPNATVVDLGGNVGFSALYFGNVLPASRLLVVEPDRANCEMAAKNCSRLIAQGRLKLIQAFASASDGEAAINRNFRSWAFRMDESASAQGERIRCASMPTLLQESGFTTVDLLKCDIEGAEADLFKHCGPWIDRVKHLVVETHMPYRNADLLEALRANGWVPQVLEEVQDAQVGVVLLGRDPVAAALPR